MRLTCRKAANTRLVGQFLFPAGAFRRLGWAAFLTLSCLAVSGKAESSSPSNSQEKESTQFWSFSTIGSPKPPLPNTKGWSKNPIDAFILAKLEEHQLKPASAASRVVLLRRAYFDLIGLPPKPDEVEAFSKDKRPEAYAELIERLLASPQYGERWGRHWLDVVRYADTGGSETDLLFENAWKFRDYVIRSLNADKPFDRFIQEQIAGDELWPDDPEAVTATALYSIGPVLEESAMVSNQLEYEWLTDAADTTGAAFLGLTLGCARCHNHKYDPISQKDYFAFQALFAGSDRAYPEAIREKRIKFLNGFLAEKPLPEEMKHDLRCKLKTETEVGLRLIHLDAPMEVRLLRRGELSKPGDTVEPSFPSAFASRLRQLDLAGVPATRRRAALAKWLTSPAENPLTPRVIVNRVWGWHFGQGIVRTPNDFGAQGEPPTHRELLDWLARDFAEHGWSLKRFHRLIMLSSAYQMQSLTPPEALRVDPENRLLSHFSRQRLEGEEIWDNLHATAGTLNRKTFGPPIVPPLTDAELSALFNAKTKWKVTSDPEEYNRRGVYILVRRTFLLPMFDAFDPPDVTTSCARRLETTVPTQALTLLNSKVTVEQSKAFAARLLQECGPQPDAILRRAWLLAFNRPIMPSEATEARAFLQKRQTALIIPDSEQTSSPGSRPLTEALTELCLALFNANEFTSID